MHRKSRFRVSFSSLAFLLSAFSLISPLMVRAATYQAVCDPLSQDEHDKKYPAPSFPDPSDPDPYVPKCTVKITLNSEVIKNRYTSIPISRITSWGVAGESKTDVGGGVATTILLGPIGLLGFLSKKHDYNLAVNGYDEDGKRATILMQFKDGKQPKRLTTEMTMLTGLAMGQKRSIQEIKKIEANGGSLEPDNIGRMRTADNLEQKETPNTLYESSADTEKRTCFLGWCRE